MNIHKISKLNPNLDKPIYALIIIKSNSITRATIFNNGLSYETHLLNSVEEVMISHILYRQRVPLSLLQIDYL
jgi:hypothetical protein